VVDLIFLSSEEGEAREDIGDERGLYLRQKRATTKMRTTVIAGRCSRWRLKQRGGWWPPVPQWEVLAADRRVVEGRAGQTGRERK
jgi:hypothetical protein